MSRSTGLLRSAWRRRSRRDALLIGASALVAGISPVAFANPVQPLRFGLTPVFLTDDLELISQLQSYLARATGQDIVLLQRRTYQEITALLMSGQLDAAWICGYPYVAYRDRLALLAVPVWNGQPLYRSYVIVGEGRKAEHLEELEGDIHAFSDPDSNSGYLVTRAALAEVGRRAEQFFKRTIFTYSHRNVVKAVGAGLVSSGSVDGYVWDVLDELEPDLTRETRILRRSELLGFPPVVCPQAVAETPSILGLRQALLQMSSDPQGHQVLRTLRLDAFMEAPSGIYDGIANKMAQVRSLG